MSRNKIGSTFLLHRTEWLPESLFVGLCLLMMKGSLSFLKIAMREKKKSEREEERKGDGWDVPV